MKFKTTTIFLQTANRVCVAMSRAKHGFYIFGNMDFLAQNCTTKRPSSSSDGDNTNIWAGIRQSLLDTGSIGTALPIVCQLHENAQANENLFLLNRNSIKAFFPIGLYPLKNKNQSRFIFIFLIVIIAFLITIDY
jgi:hypothetical protein